MERKILGFSFVIGILILSGVFYMATNRGSVSNNEAGRYDDFAKCLTSKNVIMYGTDWCPHCQKQKALFGNSFKYVNYKNCQYEPEACESAGIEAYPTWIINNRKYLGTRSLQELAELSGCLLNE